MTDLRTVIQPNRSQRVPIDQPDQATIPAACPSPCPVGLRKYAPFDRSLPVADKFAQSRLDDADVPKRERTGVNRLGEHFQRIDQARAGAIEEGVAIGEIHAAIPHRS